MTLPGTSSLRVYPERTPGLPCLQWDQGWAAIFQRTLIRGWWRERHPAGELLLHKSHNLIHIEFPVKLMVSSGLFVGKILAPSREGMMGGVDWPISLGPYFTLAI